MWLKADPSPTSTTDNPVNPEGDEYEAVRERFYAEGWDEGRKRRRRGEPDRTVFREWYGEEIKPEATAQPEQATAQSPPSSPSPQSPPTPAPEQSEPQRLVTAEHALAPPPTFHSEEELREVSLADRVTQGESTVNEDTPKEAATKEAAAKEPVVESEPLIRIAMAAEHVALLTLNTPKIRNALTADMRLALRGALKALAANDQVHALVITGADGNFCAGGDVRTMGETDPHKIRQRMTEVAETALAVASFPKPVIAAVAGHAAGAGVSLACLADIIVVDESTQFTFSFLRLALGPDWGLSWSLPRRVGATKARSLILSRGVIDAREAQQIGLADHHASEGETQIAAIEIAKKLCNGPREATAAVKTMLSDLDGLRAALDAEMQMQLERFPSWEHQEGATAFKEKRPADFGKKSN